MAREGYTDQIASRRLVSLMRSPLARSGAWLALAVAAMLTMPLRLHGEGEPVSRVDGDILALESFRPGYQFWRHIFMIPDGSIAFGSAHGWADARGPSREGRLESAPGRTRIRLSRTCWPTPRCRRVSTTAGRGWPNCSSRWWVRSSTTPRAATSCCQARVATACSSSEWGRIYERFGVPAEIGLAQAAIESGLSGTRKSEARAIGFCQWLQANWKQLNRLAPAVIEGANQTTQAPYCAAYLTILATKYGSFIPALSDHHSGGVNVGRILINGERLGGTSVREQYLLGSQLARDLRRLDLYGFRDLYRTYGPRSYVYAEMVFGNMATVRESDRVDAAGADLRDAHAARAHAVGHHEADEAVRGRDPALQPGAGQARPGARRYVLAACMFVTFGRDVSFWHRPANEAYAAALSDFLSLDAPPEHWDDGTARCRRCAHSRDGSATADSEEGTVMATVLAYVIERGESSGRREILAAFRADESIREPLRSRAAATRPVEPDARWPARRTSRVTAALDVLDPCRSCSASEFLEATKIAKAVRPHRESSFTSCAFVVTL